MIDGNPFDSDPRDSARLERVLWFIHWMLGALLAAIYLSEEKLFEHADWVGVLMAAAVFMGLPLAIGWAILGFIWIAVVRGLLR